MSTARRGPVLITVFVIPREPGGTSIVARRLIENLAPGEAIVLGRAPNRRARLEGKSFPVPTIRTWWLPLGLRGERFWRIAGVVPGVVQGLLAIRRRRCAAIMAMFPDECSLLTGYLLHRLTGLPILAYFCDLYMEDRRGDGWEARLARWLQPRVFRAAARLVAVNRGMAEFYRERYGLDALTVPTCINQEVPAHRDPPPPGTPFRIAYSGNVNSTRIDSLRALIAAVGGNPAYAIRYFTPQSPDYLRSLGVWADNASVEFVADDAALVRRLAECDTLFLPLTFATTDHARDQMATCFGIKAYEYLLAQRPVLVHCPADYFLARFFRDGGCGLVVDDPSPQAVGAGIRRLRDDGALRAELTRKGLEAARQFEGSRVAGVLRAGIDAVLDTPGGRPR